MADNFVQNGRVLELTAPTGGVKRGNIYMSGQVPVVALDDAAAAAKFQGDTAGVWELPAVAHATAKAIGAPVYVDATAANVGKVVTTSASGDTQCGSLMRAYVAQDTTALVRLDGIARAAV